MNNQRQTDAKMSKEEAKTLGYVLIDQLDCTHLYIYLEQNIEVSWLRDDDDDGPMEKISLEHVYVSI